MLLRVSSQSTVITPLPGALEPELVSDGGGLPFAPGAIFASFDPLDPSAAPVRALLTQIELGSRRARRRGLLRRAAPAPALDESQKLAGWRALARSEDEILYARGRPPQLLTVAVRRERGERWQVVGVSNSRPLRSVRDGVRASSWRPDPDFPPAPQDSELHLLLTEQTMATGLLAADRLLPAELFSDAQRLLLRLYVKPLEGYVGRTRRHETPVTVRLPEAVGARELVDGALYDVPS